MANGVYPTTSGMVISKEAPIIKYSGTLDTKCGSVPGFLANYVMEKNDKEP